MGHYDRLSAEDRLFLDLEDAAHGRSTMHVGGCFLFEAAPVTREGGAVDIDAIREYVESRLYRIPRYRQRIAYTPYEEHPIWIDDDSFNILYHVRHARLPLPGDERQLKRLCGRILSQQLDRAKPLWELWIVEGLEDDRIAMVTKVHHCMVDGISGVDLLQTLLRTTPEKTIDPAPTWLPQPAPTREELVRDGVVRGLRAPFELLAATARALAEPRQLIDGARDALDIVRELREFDSNPASDSILNHSAGPHRRFDWVAFDLDAVKAVRRGLGGTVNDVVVATVAGAIGRFFELRGIPEAEQREIDFRIACPVNTRPESKRGTLGNHVSMMFVSLPIHERDPVRRYALTRDATGEAKASKQAEAMQAFNRIGELTSPAVLTTFAQRALERHTSNLVVTNVPGPQVPLYLLGARMLETYPVVPLSPGQALGVALFSYDGGLYWGLNSDWDLLPDLHDMVLAIDDSFRELCAAAEEPDADAAQEASA